jgi:5'-3' exonuclease
MRNLIIDGGNLLHRTYYTANKKPVFNKFKMNVGHVYWFLSKIKELQEDHKCDNIFVAWDIRDKDFVNFRQSAVDYKGSRDRTKDVDVHKFDEIIWKACESLGMRCFRANKLEADDIISWICSDHMRSADENIVVSSDQDFIQLLHLHSNTNIYSMSKYTMLTVSNITEFTNGVKACHHLLFKAVMGDDSDNINGLFRYGKVKSAKFVKDFRVNYDNLNKDDQEVVFRNIRIMDLREGMRVYPDEVEFYRDQIKEPTVNMTKFFEICNRLDLSRISKMKSIWRRTFDTNTKDDLLSLLL